MTIHMPNYDLRDTPRFRDAWIIRYITGLYGSRCDEYCKMNHVRFRADNDRFNEEEKVDLFHKKYC